MGRARRRLRADPRLHGHRRHEQPATSRGDPAVPEGGLSLQIQRIVDTAQRLKAKQVACDSTGVGDPIAQELWRKGLTVNPVTITAQSKAEMIDRLSLA